MQNRISYYILSLLYHEGRVRIPGIGKIVRKQLPAELSDTVIKPPHAESDFSQAQNGKNKLLERFIAYHMNSSRTTARRELALFSRDLKSEMKNEGSVQVKYLGTFSKQGDSIHFSPNEEYINPAYAGSIPLPAHIASLEEPEMLPYATRDVSLPESPDVQSKKPFHPPQEEIAPEESIQPTESLKADQEDEVIAPSVVIPSEKHDVEEQVESDREKEVLVPPIVVPSDSKEAEETKEFDREEELIVPPIILPVEKKEPEPPTVQTPIVTSKHEQIAPVLAPKTQTVPKTPAPRTRKAPPPPPKEDRVNVLLPIMGLIVLGLLVGAFLFYQSRVSNDETAIVTDTTIQDVTPVQPSSPLESDQGDVVETDPALPGETEENKVALGDTGSNEGSTILDEGNGTPSESANQGSTILDEEAETPTVPATPHSENPVDDPDTPPTTSSESRYTATGECIIVVGAFSMSSNTDRMLSRLNDLGYTTLTKPNGNLTQVGVPVDCKAKNLQTVLSFLRTNVEKAAWVRRPE